MILDYSLLVANDLAYGGSPTAINLGTASAGPGKPIKMFIQGNGSIAGATGFAITDCDTLAGSYTAVESITCTAAEINTGMEFSLPPHIRKYVKVALSGTASAGAWTCGVILEGFQSAQ